MGNAANSHARSTRFDETLRILVTVNWVVKIHAAPHKAQLFCNRQARGYFSGHPRKTYPRAPKSDLKMTRQKKKVSKNSAPVFGGHAKQIALIDTRAEVPYETVGTLISMHDTMQDAFEGNEIFQTRMRAAGIKSHIVTKIVELKERLRPGEQVHAAHLAGNIDPEP